MFSNVAPTVALLAREVNDQRGGVPDRRAHDQCSNRSLAGAVCDGQPCREVPCARQRIDLPPIGEDDRVEAGDQAGASGQRENARGRTVAENCPEAQEQRFVGSADYGRTGRDTGIQDHGQECEHDERA